MGESNNKYNFKDPIKEPDKKEFDSYVNKSRNDLKSRLFGNKDARNSSIWILFFALLISFSIILLAIFLQLQNKERDLQAVKQEEGVIQEEKDSEKYENVIATGRFSLVPNTEPPSEFSLTIQGAAFPYIPERQGQKIEYLAQIEVDGQENTLLSGLEAYVTQSDSEYTNQELAERVADELGDDFAVASEISINNDKILLPIENTANPEADTFYYVSVTEDNYYIFILYNQVQDSPEYVRITRFTDMLIDNLWLN
jgi:hypothetical protein